MLHSLHSRYPLPLSLSHGLAFLVSSPLPNTPSNPSLPQTDHQDTHHRPPIRLSAQSITGLTTTHHQPHLHRGQLYTPILNFELLGFYFRYFPTPLALPPLSLPPPSIGHPLAQIWFYFFAAWVTDLSFIVLRGLTAFQSLF